jgi:hypothetical protein
MSSTQNLFLTCEINLAQSIENTINSRGSNRKIRFSYLNDTHRFVNATILIDNFYAQDLITPQTVDNIDIIPYSELISMLPTDDSDNTGNVSV